MKKHTTTVLSAMVTGMDDRDDPEDLITLEAMNGLSKIISQVCMGYIHSLGDICVFFFSFFRMLSTKWSEGMYQCCLG